MSLTPQEFANLSKAAFESGRTPRAIEVLRQGLQRYPNHPGLQQYLDFVRERVDYPAAIARPAELGGILAWPSDVWLSATAVAWTLTWTLATVWIWKRTRAYAWAMAVAAAVCLAIGAGSWMASEEWRRQRTATIVVIAEEADLHLGNGLSYPRHPQVPSLPPGLEARQIGRRGEWLHIEVGNGVVGWVAQDRVER